MSDLSFITDPSKWKDITPDMYDEINAQIEQTFEEGCHGNCESCSSDCDHRESAQLPKFAKRMYAVNGQGSYSGSALMHGGIPVPFLYEDFASLTFEIQAIS